MATLASPFILCPISDTRDLVGLSQGEDEDGSNVIVTLGKNIAIKYSIPEQKQETSWTVSNHWFTSKVVYCKELEKCAAVFDNHTIGLWKKEDVNLQRLKRHKFNQQLHDLIPTPSGLVLTFNNGLVSFFASATSTGSKEFDASNGSFNPDDKVVLEVSVNHQNSLAYVVAGRKHSTKPRSKLGSDKQESLFVYIWDVAAGAQLSELTIAPGEELVILGWCILSAEHVTSLVYLCSNGHLKVKKLFQNGEVCQNENSDLKMSSFDQHVSTTNTVVLQAYDATTIVCYGPSKNEDGATVFLYDLKYDLVLSKQGLKLYNWPAIMAKIQSYMIIPSGSNLLVINIRSSKTLLSTVVGRNKIQGLDFFELRDPWKTGWEQDNKLQPLEKAVQVQDVHDTSMYDGLDIVDLKEIVSTLESNGHPEASICAHVIPQALEKGDATALKWILQYFQDIPESHLVQLLPSAISLYLRADDSEGTSNEISTAEDKGILFTILSRTFDKQEMVKCLKSLSYTDSQKLLLVLNKFLSNTTLTGNNENTSVDESTQFLSKTMQWISVVLDAHYTNIVFTGETKLIDEVLKNIDDRIALMQEVAGLAPLVEVIMNKTKYETRPNPNSMYRVQSVVFR